MLRKLNAEYEEKFPGLRYVYVSPSSLPLSSLSFLPRQKELLTTVCSVFVNGRTRPVVMENMRSRIARGDVEEERREAIQVSPQIPRNPFPVRLTCAC
jgi:hypothetical protein